MHIENEYYRVEVDQSTGALTQVRDKQGGFDLVSEPRLAASFRLLVPLPELRSNYLDGLQQDISTISAADDRMEIRYDGPLVGPRGTYDIAMTLRIEFADERLLFSCRLTNNCPHAVSEVWYPMLGGMTGLGEGESGRDARALVPFHYVQRDMPIFRKFGGRRLGLPCCEQVFTYPAISPMPWMSLYHPEKQRAIYFAAPEREVRTKAVRLQLDPGIASGREESDWPTPDEAGDLPVGVTAEWIFFPHTGQGESFQSPPVVLQAHTGDWRESAALYRKWFESEIGVVDSSNQWLRAEPVILDTIFMLAEDNINLTFKEIPAWAAEAVKWGIRTVLITGWDIGGHDRGYPEYAVEPKLGSWKELVDGIRACHEMGLKVMFFANLQWADGSTDWYRDELLHRGVYQDPAGPRDHTIPRRVGRYRRRPVPRPATGSASDGQLHRFGSRPVERLPRPPVRPARGRVDQHRSIQIGC